MNFLDSFPSVVRNGDRRIGFALLGGGALVTMLGVALFFNKALLRMGNFLFICGVPMTMGPSRTMSYFLRREKMRATACLGLGIFLVLIAGRPVLGMILQVFGLLNIFGNMFPFLLAIAKQMPIVGTILNGEGGNSGRSNKNRNNHARRTASGNRNHRDDEHYRRQEYKDDFYYQDDAGDDGEAGEWRDERSSDFRYY